MTNTKKVLIISILFLFTLSFSFAQNRVNEGDIKHKKFMTGFSRGKARLKGIVKNEEGTLIENALVVLIYQDGVSKFVQKTNKRGVWNFMGLGTGMFIVTINHKGYKPFKVIKKVFQLSQNSTVKCILRKETTNDKFKIEIKQLSHKINSSIRINEKIYVLLNYKIPKNYTEGVYIWAVPVAAKTYNKFSTNIITRDIESSALITKKHGTLTRYFSIKNGNRMIKKINILMKDKDKDKILAKHSMKVNYFTQPKSKPSKGAPFGRELMY